MAASSLTNKKKLRGFTLLEVLISLVILSLAFSATFLSLTVSARNLLALKDKTAAQWVAMNVIAKTQAGFLAIPQDNGNTRGEEKMFDMPWAWVLSVYPTQDAYVARLNVAVSKLNSEGTLVNVTGYVLKRKTNV